MTNRYDAIVIGGGHNGLATGALLAKAGADVVVLEKRRKTGGAADTSAPWPEHPDWNVTTLSYVTGMIPPAIVADLELERHGYKVLPMGPVYQAFPDGRSLTLQSDDDKSRYDEVARFSKKDADAIFAYEETITTAAELLGRLLLKAPAALDSDEPIDPARLLWYLRRETDPRTAAQIASLLTMSVTDLLDRYFESEQLRGALTVDGVIGMWAGPDEPGSAFALAFESVTGPGPAGLSGSWGYAEGGMGAVAGAFRGSAESFGSTVRTEAPVANILIESGRATGVVLDGGEEIYAPLVVTACHPKITFLRHIERADLPEEFVRRIEDWKTRSGDVKINLALSALPEFIADPDPVDGTVPRHLTGSMELSFSTGYVQRAFEDARSGRPAEAPYVDAVIPTVFDGTLAPEGIHIMSMHTQWVPCDWVNEPHRDDLEAYADRVVDLYTELAPNFKSTILARQVLGPFDMEQEFDLIGGNAYHGELSMDQLLHLRPAARYANYRTPIDGLYQAHSATHAGGGVNALPAMHCVGQILKDRSFSRPPARSA